MSNIINRFEIKAFRKHEGLSFDRLGRVNLLVGENNSGKTSVLEAIQYFCSPMDPSELIGIAHSREAERELDTPTALRWLFPKEKFIRDPEHLELAIDICAHLRESTRTVHCDFELTKTAIVSSHFATDLTDEERANLKRQDWRRTVVKLKYNYSDQVDEQISAFATGAVMLIEGQDHFTISENVHLGKIPCVVLSPVSHRIGSSQRVLLSKATIDFLKRDVVGVLQLIDEDIRGIEILEPFGRSVIYVEVAALGFVPVSTLGDGIRRVLSYAISLSEAQGGILVIDEIETAIYKDVLAKVFSWLISSSKNLDVQLVATTHSLEAIDAILGASLSSIEDLVVFQLPDREKTGLKRFSGEQLENLRFEQGWDVR